MKGSKVSHRAGIRRVVIPKENEKDLCRLPSHVHKQLEIHPVECIEDVFQIAIADAADRLFARRCELPCAALRCLRKTDLVRATAHTESARYAAIATIRLVVQKRRY